MAMPDATALAVGYLDSLHSQQVASRVPNPRPAEFIWVREVGGAALPPVRVVARLDILTYAATEVAAATLAGAVRAEMFALAGTTQGGVICYRVEETIFRQFDDPEDGSPRYLQTVALTLRANDVLPR